MDVFDFNQTQGFAKGYLRTYYAGEPQIDEQEVSRLLVREAPRLPRGKYLELGCGPTLHHVMPLAPFVTEIHLRDYLEENLAEVRAWHTQAAGAHDWRAFTRMSLRDAGLEDGPGAVATREALVRQRITRIDRCNLMAPTPAGDRGAYAAVGCFYVTEEVGISPAAWRAVMQRVADYVAPGGTLLLALLAGMTSYRVVQASGRVDDYPCACVTTDDLRQVLPGLGFPLDAVTIEAKDIPLPDCGVTATLTVVARKSGPMPEGRGATRRA